MKENAPHTFSFGTDFHGNLDNVDAFLQASKERDSRYVFFGGDLSPKKMATLFRDDKAIPVTPQLTDYVMPQPESLEFSDSSLLYRRGHILIEDGLTSEDFRTFIRIAQKIINSLDKLDFRKSWLNVEEIAFFENEMIPRMVSFFQSEKGSRASETFMREFHEMSRRAHVVHNIKDVRDVLEAFSFGMKLICASQNGCKTPEKARKFIYQKNNSMKRFRQDLDDSQAVNNVSIKNLIASYFDHGAPIRLWADKLQDLHSHSLPGQRAFIRDFFQHIAEFRQQGGGAITAIPGNDDREELLEDFRDAERAGIIHSPQSGVQIIDPDVQILGYSRVPPAPANYDYWYLTDSEIRDELLKIGQGIRSDIRFCVANIHASPAGTALGMGSRYNYDTAKPITEDFGSKGVREFLEKAQPDLALCGHIHESWKITGSIRDQIGKTVAVNPGASEFNPRFVFGQLENLEDLEIVEGADASSNSGKT